MGKQAWSGFLSLEIKKSDPCWCCGEMRQAQPRGAATTLGHRTGGPSGTGDSAL